VCGIAPADTFPELGRLREWLDRGYGGDMRYLERSAATRADIRHFLPAARAVVVTATVYYVDEPPSDDAIQVPAAIARYARGADYHDVLASRLDELVTWMRERSPVAFESRIFVDKHHVQERAYAKHAGVGWIGKNTCLINPELGSWLFLAEIICTLPLEPDTQGLEQCGSCTRCLEACPTNALVEPGVLDSNRCLSYLTIELRSEIPDQHRRAFGSHIYGCDICQEVCPYNRPAPRSDAGEWQPRAGLDLPRLVELWRRPDAELRRMTKGSPVTRAKLAGLRRNIAVAIGNSGDADAIDALDGEIDERPSVTDPLVRTHIDWARAQRPRPKA
jgi:epoxyqueuosine reductase